MRPPTSQEGQPQVNVKLDARGGQSMLAATRDNVGRRMAVVYISKKQLAEGEQCKGARSGSICTEEDVISAATIQSVLSSSFRITGLQANEARELALLLRSGALAAPQTIVEQRSVGPSLGADNIRRGWHAMAVGLVLTFAFMAMYYRAFGWIANLVLAANLVLTVGLLSLLQASLSLPGIAAVVFHLGIAVDANILIYERIREELRAGNSPLSAINAGFEKAFATIADSNVTTLIAGVVLFAFGTGTIRSFAIVMTLGILTSLFTSVVGSRALVHWIWGRRQRLSAPAHLVTSGNRTMEFFHKVTTYPFMHTRRMWYGVSGVAIIASIVLLFWHGLNLGIDFTGGVELEFAYPHKADIEKTRATLQQAGYQHAQVQNYGDDSSIMVRLLPQENEDVNAVSKAVNETLRKVDPSVELRRAEVVGPQVGEELTNQGGLAVLFTFVLIGIYTWFRFQWKMGISAVIATLHDPLIILGFFAVTQIPFDLAVLAAILAVIGYSLNDTVVVFDRVRENFHKIRKRELRRSDGRLDQPDPVANDHHQRRDAARRRRAADHGRRDAARLLLGADDRHHRRHVFLDLRRRRAGARYEAVGARPDGAEGNLQSRRHALTP